MTLPWHHSPVHSFVSGAVYMVTGGTLNKDHFFRSPDWLEFLQNKLLAILKKHGWIMHAWAVFVNHYHFIAEAPKTDASLSALINEFHSTTATEANRLDGTIGRQVWFQNKANPAFVREAYSFHTDRLKIADDF